MPMRIGRFLPSDLSATPTRGWLDALPYGLCAVDPAGTIQLTNREAGRLLGWQADECHGRNLHDLIGCQLSEPASEETCPLSAVLRSGTALPLLPGWIRDRYDRMIPVQCGLAPVFGGAQSRFLFAFHDLRDQIQRDETLLHLASMPEEAPFPIVELNEDGSLLYANPAMARLLQDFGYTPSAFPRLLPADIEEIARLCLRTGGTIGGIEVALEDAWYGWTFCPVLSRRRVRGYAIDLGAVWGPVTECRR
ncbi:MAG TPA: PAS domain-containing protein [Nitrospirales bacterium]|nr:PAS domain-containing protein [Nitrospirales bacterium]